MEDNSQDVFKEKILKIAKEIVTMLVEKNRKYGNSALEPCRIFSKSSALEQIYVRLDDKLSRISNRQSDEDEDVINDMIGYLFLAKIKINELKETKNIPLEVKK